MRESKPALVISDIVMPTMDRAAPHRARARGGGQFDLIVSDLLMPNGSGMDLHARLSDRDADMARRMIFMTDGAITPRAVDFLEAVGNHKLDKPIALTDLMGIIDEEIAADDPVDVGSSTPGTLEP